MAPRITDHGSLPGQEAGHQTETGRDRHSPGLSGCLAVCLGGVAWEGKGKGKGERVGDACLERKPEMGDREKGAR